MNRDQAFDEKAALERLIAGDHQAFTQLYMLYLGNLHRYVSLFFADKVTADEIVQDIFIKIWEKRESLAVVQSFRSYLFKSAKNHLLNSIRNEQIRQRVLGAIAQQSPSHTADTQNQVDYRAYALTVEKAVRRLPPKRKRIFQLSVKEGYSLDEIAALLRIGKPVVKKQLYAAYDFVRDYLRRNGDIVLCLLFLSLLLP